jgi:hypothetical protein
MLQGKTEFRGMSERQSCLQQAEREITRWLLEGPEHAFFEGMGGQIVCAD